MKILKLEISNILECRQAQLEFNANDVYPVYIVHSPKECKALTLAIQLICNSKYDSEKKLYDILGDIEDGKVSMTFTLPYGNRIQQTGEQVDLEHSSDSDVPCSSTEALKRAQRRNRRKVLQQKRSILITATRVFAKNLTDIEYSVDNGKVLTCSTDLFHVRFFTCTDIILPHLSGLSDGVCCNGRWLDLLSKDFLYKKVGGENNLIADFCYLFSKRKHDVQHQLGQLTTAALTGNHSLDQARIFHLIYIFQDIRGIFEYITGSEYTVYFLIPTVYGTVKDITEITTSNINFNSMKTKFQQQPSSNSSQPAPKVLWTQADDYVQELFLVAVQLAFAYHSQQNILYLHSLQKLNKHQSFEYLNEIFAKSRGGAHWNAKNYLQLIINVCAKFNLTCVIALSGGIPFVPKYAFLIRCVWDVQLSEWKMSAENCAEDDSNKNSRNMNNLLKDIESTFNK